jgi:hypothetical protein
MKLTNKGKMFNVKWEITEKELKAYDTVRPILPGCFPLHLLAKLGNFVRRLQEIIKGWIWSQ